MITQCEIKKITSLILKQDFNQQVKDAALLGRLLWHNHTGIYSLNDFEESIIHNADLEIEKNFKSIESHTGTILFVVTEAYLTGGHTRLMEQLALGSCSNVELLITKKAKKEVIQRLQGYFTNITYMGDVFCEKEKIANIFEMLSRYKRIVLNIHPDDIISTIACGLLKKRGIDNCIYFINHADHVFSYGTTVADIWFQISAFGSKIDHLRHLRAKVSFLGIPIKVNADGYNHDSIPSYFITAGASNKYKPVKDYSIFPLLFTLLKKYKKSKFTAIGPNAIRDYWWWLLKLRYPLRVRILRRIPFDKYMAITKNAEVFIDSHPIPGGTAFAEQYLQGKICIGLVSPFQGYTPVEMLKKYRCEDVLFQRQESNEKMINESFKKFHGVECVSQRFNETVLSNKIFKNICEEQLNWSGDITFDWDKMIRTIPSDFPCGSVVTKFAMTHCSVKALCTYYSKKVINTLMNIAMFNKR